MKAMNRKNVKTDGGAREELESEKGRITETKYNWMDSGKQHKNHKDHVKGGMTRRRRKNKKKQYR